MRKNVFETETYKICFSQVEDIKAGDIILCEDNKLRTVCNKDIKHDFMGISIFGNSYKLGTEKVKKVLNYRN